MSNKEKGKYICRNKYCKATYNEYKELYKESERYKMCKGCRKSNEELSGGVNFENKQYRGERFDKSKHETEFKFSDFLKGKWGKLWEK